MSNMRVFYNKRFTLLHIFSVSGGVSMCGVKPETAGIFPEDDPRVAGVRRCGKCATTRSNYTGATK